MTIAGDGIDHPGGYNSMLVNRVESAVRVILLYDIYIYIMYTIRTRSPDVRLRADGYCRLDQAGP